jgi:hypothetical protein
VSGETLYSELRPSHIHATLSLLHRRIHERFPTSGLSAVAGELVLLAEQNATLVERLRRPVWWLRALVLVCAAAVLGLAVWATAQLVRVASGSVGGISDVLQGMDAAVNETILLALVLLFLASLETRFKRRAALRMLHRLRSVAHVIDMHQLIKDPEHAVRAVAGTPSSPERSLDRGQLTRYLDYCAELLSLISKLAALHAQHVRDPVVLEAVNDIESLTSGLSGKVWQKIAILDAAAAP